jgi:drug/metabolite transporter (DMT)-like permease
MTQQDERAKGSTDHGRTVESILQTVTQDLKRLHGGLVAQLSEEVTQLQTEKARLAEEVATLRSQHHALQAQNTDALSRQQLAQQQLWAKQLALALAGHLQGLMAQQINQAAKNGHFSGNGTLSTSDAHSENAHRLLASLDSTFNATFKTLQQELGSYQSALSQQLNRMHTMEQQGEAILDALVNRLQEQTRLENGGFRPMNPPLDNPSQRISQPVGNAVGNGATASSLPFVPPARVPAEPQASAVGTSLPPSTRYSSQSAPIAPMPIAVPGQPPLPVAKKDSSKFWAGLFMVMLSTVALSVHNVVVRVIGRPSPILGMPDVGGFINTTILGNSLLILWLRMMVVLPLMIGVALVLYPPVWRDLRKFANLWHRDRRPVYVVVGSGLFLFLSQVLVYIAIGKIGPGPAVTLLFIYPILTVPLAWVTFGDRPTRLRWIVMVAILIGVVLTAIPKIIATSRGFSLDGVLVAIGSGVAFALYLVFMQMGFKKLHPVPVSLVQFFTTFVLSSVVLIFAGPNLGAGIAPENRGGFLVGGIILGALTLVGYLANNFGVRFMGAGSASIVSSAGPVLTAMLAWILIQDKLQPIQWWGILIVTLSIAALSVERMKLSQPKGKL